MPREQWPHRHGRPSVEVVLTLALNKQPFPRTLLADTGAGAQNCGFDLLMDEQDCVLGGGNPQQSVNLGGAYTGSFPIYLLTVKIPTLAFAKSLYVVGIPSPPIGFDGIACFSFLNRFHYGNFGNQGSFGLET